MRLEVLEVMRCVLICMLEAVEGRLYLQEVQDGKALCAERVKFRATTLFAVNEVIEIQHFAMLCGSERWRERAGNL